MTHMGEQKISAIYLVDSQIIQESCQHICNCGPVNDATPVACLFQNNGDVSAKDYAHVMLIYDELLLSEFKPPLLNDRLPVP